MKFLDVGHTYTALRAELDAAAQSVLDSGWFLNGLAGAAFEAEFAAYCGTGTCVGVANGLDALELTLRAIGCGPGDEVIVPAHTFVATWLAVSATGATIVPVDADAATMNLDLGKLAAAASPRTRAVIPVHLYGAPVDVDAVRAAIGRPIFVLEDAAQAHGARLRGRRAGSLGDAAAFSFYPAKNLGAFGDGGAVTTADADLAARVRRLANYGAADKYVHVEKGRNSRLDEIQAAVLSVKLRVLDAWNARRGAIAGRYLQAFAGLDGLELPQIPVATEPAWHLFVVRSAGRDRLAAALQARGVPVQLHYPVPPHLSQAYAGDFHAGAFPATEAICATCLSLPIGPHLADEDVEHVCAAVQACAATL